MDGRPEFYPTISPYLVVRDARALMAFFAEVFGAQERFVAPGPGAQVIHGEMGVGNAVIMLSDALETPYPPAHLCIYVDDTDAVFAKAVAAGAEVLSEPETKEYGDRSAGIKDPAGNTWWISTRLADESAQN